MGCRLPTSIQNEEGLSCNNGIVKPQPIMLGNVPGKPFTARARPFPHIKVRGGRFYNSFQTIHVQQRFYSSLQVCDHYWNIMSHKRGQENYIIHHHRP